MYPVTVLSFSDPYLCYSKGLIMLIPPHPHPTVHYYTIFKKLPCMCISWMNPWNSVTPSLTASKCELLSIWSKEWNVFPIWLTAVKYVPLSFTSSLQSPLEFWCPLQLYNTLDIMVVAGQCQLLQKAPIQMDHAAPITLISWVCLFWFDLHFQTVRLLFFSSQGYRSFHTDQTRDSTNVITCL